MILEAKLLAPLSAMGILAYELAASLPEVVNIALNIAALVTIASGLLVYGRMRAGAEAANTAADAWQSERDAAVSKASRLESELSEARIRIAQLEAQPTLDTLEKEIMKLGKIIEQARVIPSDS